MRGGVAVP